jgi:hypothetical protein
MNLQVLDLTSMLFFFIIVCRLVLDVLDLNFELC